ncbi:MAG: hypothetical protein GY795_24650 [Desulfobacterales bacterium]|nr:hypothetical protein [Desulfobacterales bacterium]
MHRLPTNPDELLTDEQHEALRRDLSKMAEQRRRSEAEARDLPMAAVSDEDGSTEGTE